MMNDTITYEDIRKAAHCFRTDEETIEKFLHDFFSAPDIIAALKVRSDFIKTHIHSTIAEDLDDFLIYMSDRWEDNGT